MKNDLETLRHSTAHLLAAAVKELYPETILGIGPVVENGFYYDFGFKKDFSTNDFVEIEAKMKEISSKALPYEKIEKEVDVAIIFAKKLKEPLKVELIQDLKNKGEKKVSFYQTGNFVDLCTGPHIKNSSEIKEFKLLSSAAAYWKGDEKNISLTRIYGTAWETKTELEDYLDRLERAKENDHRKLGKELGLFVFSDIVGQGLPLLTAKGAVIRRELERFIVDEELRRGYKHVVTPPLAKVDLYRLSGHYPYYKDTMYPPMKVDQDELILRPMTCPHHFMLYRAEPHSYRELPLRLAEISPQFRYEKSGELSGLMRVRMFTLTDAHIFCSATDAQDEIKKVLELIDFMNSALGLQKGVDYRFRLSLGERANTKKYYKSDAEWDRAEKLLRNVLDEVKAPYFEAKDEAAFYGPKIDIQMKNVAGKEETAYTVQYDFVQPKKFDLTYIDEQGQEVQPIVIHRSSLGALERTMAFLIEHYAGKLPFWLSPVQFAIIPIADRHSEYANAVADNLTGEKLRVEINSKSSPMGAKIREAQLQKIPYMLIIGDKEQAQKSVAVRTIEGEDLGMLTLSSLVKMVTKQTPQHS